MRLIRGLTNLRWLSRQAVSPLAQGCVATIGNFDGVHVGHQTIIEQVKDRAAARNLPAVAVIFEPQPREFFQGADAPPRLTAFRQKFRALLAAGIDLVVCLKFDEHFRSYTGMEFINELLIEGLAVKHLVVGDDFRFGCDRSGDFSLLETVGDSMGFSVENTRTVLVDGERVSSTRVRRVLAENDLAAARALLGRPYAIEGKVVYGRQLGRQLDAPTANILLKKMPPLRGVYVVSVELAHGDAHHGVANIGLRPTVDGRQPALEVHLFDFTGRLYGQRIRVTFKHPLRDEQKFESVEALKTRIAQDFQNARAWLNGR
ncbi:bifunctional riboflavin kinase/FAD synthetase [Marinobacter sp. X15-166B]|uniref:bifunctional riboflavin kinase/FAD synthetase n=1 Tax=Marinobacter sp. X15-166B TaxID=1897620 RepID=UPI00085BC952|nr:bifunctional riboflavin kinase/FAD synthetase [Marinobacter sp. X15-166B]OEY66648.1 riboflavin biosynthesis protein RibF [Marinobacter sp. X15-166B]